MYDSRIGAGHATAVKQLIWGMNIQALLQLMWRKRHTGSWSLATWICWSTISWEKTWGLKESNVNLMVDADFGSIFQASFSRFYEAFRRIPISSSNTGTSTKIQSHLCAALDIDRWTHGESHLCVGENRMDTLIPQVGLCNETAILFGGLEPMLFFHILGTIIPIDFHIFQGRSNHQPV